MSEEVLSEVQNRFNQQVQKAYRSAYRNLNNKIVGEQVELSYPLENGLESRVPEVEGVVRDIDTGKLVHKNIDFAVFIEFEDGRTFIDPESIVITQND